jgi:hypothetical protein
MTEGDLLKPDGVTLIVDQEEDATAARHFVLPPIELASTSLASSEVAFQRVIAVRSSSRISPQKVEPTCRCLGVLLAQIVPSLDSGVLEKAQLPIVA